MKLRNKLLILSVCSITVLPSFADDPKPQWWSELHNKIDLEPKDQDFINSILTMPPEKKNLFLLGQLYANQFEQCSALMKTVNETDVDQEQEQLCVSLRDSLHQAIVDYQGL
jgi:hypothetical protein